MSVVLDKFWGYFCFILTIGFTVYSQLIIKWQVNKAGSIPDGISGKLKYLIHLIGNPWILSALAAAILLLVFWVMVLTRFQLSYAYMFYTGLVLILVSGLSIAFFHEPFTLQKLFCFILIVGGLVILNLK